MPKTDNLRDVKMNWILIFANILILSVEISYEEEEIRLIVESHPQHSSRSVRSTDNESQTLSENTILSFYPSTLDFKESRVGIPRLGIVRVENRLSDETVKLISISGSTLHFHSSFFADKNIAPGGNTTFEVVFLSRAEGQVESSLYIHTSKGLFKYQVQGHGLPNPYRLKPLVGARIPVNGSYEPLITIHNPHDDPIQIVEMLASDTDFHLSLPDDVREDIQGVAWAIEPFQTKSLMKGSFQGKAEGNHTGYIKIRVNSSSTTVLSEYLVVPVEVQVSSTPGIYSPQDCLDFGLMVKGDKPKTLTLSLINALQSSVNVQSVTVKGDGNSALKIEFRPLSLEPDSSITTVVALVTFDPSKAHSPRESHGFIEIRCESGDQLSVPFRSNVLQGQLEYNSSTLGYFVKAERILPRTFSVRNGFTETVIIYDVTVSHPDIVEVQKLNQSQVISPGELKDIFVIRVHKKAELCESPSAVQLSVRSNITNLKLPVTCYDGKLDLHVSELTHMNFGRVELLSTHVEYFSVDNKNPVEVRLKSWSTNCTCCIIELVGMQKGEKEDLARIQDFESLKKSLFLQPNHMAVFSIQIRRPSVEGDFWAEAVVTTDHNQTIRVPFIYSVRKGAIYSDPLAFDKAFPGKISFEKLHLTSSFNVTMTVRGVESVGNSAAWFTTSSLEEFPEVLPTGRNYVGKVHFDPKRFCRNDCYTGFSADSSTGRSWTRGMNISWETGETDCEIFKRLQRRYDQVKESAFSNISLWVRTSPSSLHGIGYKIKTLITYAWPRLTSSKSVVFPLTALGNQSLIDIPVTNPSSSPLIVQAILAKDYGPLWSQFVQGLGIGGNTTDGNEVFFLDGLGSFSSQSNESSTLLGKVQRQAVTDMLGLSDVLPGGVVFFLPAGARFHLRVKFKPDSKEIASTLLLLRNNLTCIEAIWLKGRAGTGQMTVGNGGPGSSLQFQITEKLLQGCLQRESSSRYVQPQLTVRRSFVARNVGEIPLSIQVLEVYPPQSAFWPFTRSYAAQGEACEGYGFRILNCQPFTLLPNQTHAIDIAFSPDFTMSKVHQTLRLTDASGVQFNYSLVAMVPSGMLKTCSAAIARPSWEPILKYLLIFGLIVGIIAASLMAYFEAGTIVSSAVVATIRVISPDSNVDIKNTCKLDLKSVYDKVDNRFKRNLCQQQQQQSNLANCKSNSVTNSLAPSHSTSTAGISNSSLNVTATGAGNYSGGTTDSQGSNNVRNRKKKLNNNVPTEVNLNHSTNVPDKAHRNKTPASAFNSSSAISSKSRTDFNNTKMASSSPNISELNISEDQHNNAKKCSANNFVQNNSRKKRNQKNQNAKNNRFKASDTPPLTSGTSSPTPSKVEEETSSTTTESSSTDDFNANLVALMEDTDGKVRKLSGKSNESELFTLEVENKNKKIQGNGKGRKMSKPTFESNSNDVGGVGRATEESKVRSQKKEYNGSTGSRGSVSPKQDLSLWDTPRPPSGDGLSELAAQTEAFVMQKSGRRSHVHDHSQQFGSSLYGSIRQKSPPPSGYGNYHKMQNYVGNSSQSDTSNSFGKGISQSQQKVPGIIGQQRPGSTVSPPAVSHSKVQNGFINNVLSTTLALSMTKNTGPSNRQHMTSCRTLSNPSSPWGKESGHDSGCDMWNRKLGADFNLPTTLNSQFHPSSTPYASLSGYGNGNSFSGSVSSASNCSSSPIASTSPNGMSCGYPITSSPNNSFLFSSNNMLADDIISSLWQVNFDRVATSANTSGFPTSTGIGIGSQSHQATPNSISKRFSPPLNYSSSSSLSGQHSNSQQHGYTEHVRSESSSRLPALSSNSSNQSSFFGGISENQQSFLNGQLHQQNLDLNSGLTDSWGLPSSSNALESGNTSLFSDWSVGSTLPTSSSNSPWDDSGSADRKWPSFEKDGCASIALSAQSLAVGGPRPQKNPGGGNSTAATSELRTKPQQDVAQSQREVEAGLGFNPFLTDIWKQGDTPSWTSTFSNSKTE